MEKKFSKWVAMWGNAVSIAENRPESYSKNITLRYPVFCPFDGNRIRLTFDNYCGTDSIRIERTSVLLENDFYTVTFSNELFAEIPAGGTVLSDPVPVNIKNGQTISISFYLKDYTQMRSAVYVQGPLSGGRFGIGNLTEERDWDINISRKTNICYFLSNVSIFTEEQNKALVCYGDSITAQDWPDILMQKLKENGIENYSVIRRATSGSRILRQYSCITYESYGLMGKNRFEHEVPSDGAEAVIIQQGINDIIHPVGTDVNPFRRMSDLPTAEELEKGMNWYIKTAKKYGLKVFLGTLLPIEGWRTYADFREELKNGFNDFLRANPDADGCIDFAEAVEKPDNPKAFAADCDSGDHLHPSRIGYERMAEAALSVVRKLSE
ncbi:MAG: GDSL-type esterase/lipase family protein [Treponemataceae bacterium]|nr:GDSL-type esterase/lipase family protein [Treponemataceae bacterium]